MIFVLKPEPGFAKRLLMGALYTHFNFGESKTEGFELIGVIVANPAN